MGRRSDHSFHALVTAVAAQDSLAVLHSAWGDSGSLCPGIHVRDHPTMSELYNSSSPIQQLVLPGMEGITAKCSCPTIYDWDQGISYIIHISQSCRREGYYR